MCPIPHFSTLWLENNPNVEKCVQIHIFPHYLLKKKNVDKCVHIHIFPHYDHNERTNKVDKCV